MFAIRIFIFLDVINCHCIFDILLILAYFISAYFVFYLNWLFIMCKPGGLKFAEGMTPSALLTPNCYIPKVCIRLAIITVS